MDGCLDGRMDGKRCLDFQRCEGWTDRWVSGWALEGSEKRRVGTKEPYTITTWTLQHIIYYKLDSYTICLQAVCYPRVSLSFDAIGSRPLTPFPNVDSQCVYNSLFLIGFEEFKTNCYSTISLHSHIQYLIPIHIRFIYTNIHTIPHTYAWVEKHA